MNNGQWKNQSVLITGICGTVGRELLRQIAKHNPKSIVGLDNNESAVFFLGEEYRDSSNVRLFLEDLRDRDRLIRKMEGVDIVLHAAAFKHVILCEESPWSAIQTNIIGTQNVVDAAQINHVKRVVFTSSDKAVNPTNVMGTSKLMGERLMTAANALRQGEGPIFSSTRFGNVLGSRGSVVPLFRKQIEDGGPVTLTDPDMTRFIMTLDEAAKLVMDSVFLAQGGGVFVTKMHVIRIEDLAHVMIQEIAPRHGHDPANIEIRTIGPKSGEKMHEELMNDEEVRRTMELEDFFVILPAFRNIYESINYHYPGIKQKTIERPYNSAVSSPMEKDVLRQYLITHNLL